MVCETCRSVMWELLLQLIESPDTIIEVAKSISQKKLEVSKSPDTRTVTKLLDFWKDQNTTIPIETDFDITSLCIILSFELKKKLKSQNNQESIRNIIELLREKRNYLAHRGCLSMSFEEYNNNYIEIRAHVDLLESTINNIKPGVNCKWIRRSSSIYVNKIDRVNNEYFDPDALKELQSLVNKWRNDISLLETNTVEQSKTEEKMSSTKQIENFAEDTKCELEDSGPKDIYDNNSVMDTLSEMEDIIAIADENKMDMNEQAKRRQVKIKVLEESIVSIEKKNQLKGRKEETKRDPVFDNTENSSDETDAHLHTLEESENELKKEKIQIEKRYHDFHIHECKARYKEEMESHKKEFDELISYEKVNYDFKLKQLEEKFKCEIELNSMSGGGGIPTREEITNQFEKERKTIEKQFLESTEALNKELEKRFQILGKLIKRKEGGFN